MRRGVLDSDDVLSQGCLEYPLYYDSPFVLGIEWMKFRQEAEKAMFFLSCWSYNVGFEVSVVDLSSTQI